VIANAVMVLGSWWYSQRVYPIPYDWRRILGTMAIGASVVAVEVQVAPSTGAGGIAAAALGWLVFAAALVWTRILRREDMAALRDRVRNWTRARESRQREALG
jgi:hypothetical protein